MKCNLVSYSQHTSIVSRRNSARFQQLLDRYHRSMNILIDFYLMLNVDPEPQISCRLIRDFQFEFRPFEMLKMM